MWTSFPFFILALSVLLAIFFQNEINCNIDCSKLKYTNPCMVACKKEAIYYCVFPLNNLPFRR